MDGVRSENKKPGTAASAQNRARPRYPRVLHEERKGSRQELSQPPGCDVPGVGLLAELGVRPSPFSEITIARLRRIADITTWNAIPQPIHNAPLASL